MSDVVTGLSASSENRKSMKRKSSILLLFCWILALVSIVANAVVAQSVIYDFETPETSSPFQYFANGAFEGQFTEVIANPDASGINVSDSVAVFFKSEIAQPWAGAFAVDGLTEPVDVSDGTQICIQVHSDHIGNVGIKLEQGTSEQANWIFTVPNTLVNEWEEICFNTTLPSIEAPFQPASGMFQQLVIFFDFGTAGTGDLQTFYFDNIGTATGTSTENVMLDLALDLNDVAEPFDQVFVMGTFNEWTESNEMFNNGNGVYQTSIELPVGLYEYKFWLKGPDIIEAFTGTEQSGCVLASPDGEFVNRQILLTEDTTLPAVCWNSCYACGEGVEITINLGFPDGVAPDPEGNIYLVGGTEYGGPGGSFKLTDEDGDGIYRISYTRLPGFAGHYSFANGFCPDWSCKEDLEGQDCADVLNFNDRYMDEISGDTVISTCFGLCGDIAQCGGQAVGLLSADEQEATSIGIQQIRNTTLRVDVSSTIQNLSFDLVAMDAKIPLSGRLKNGQQDFNITNLPAGIYMVRVISDNGQQLFIEQIYKR